MASWEELRSDKALAVPATPANAVDGPTGFDPSRLLELAEGCELAEGPDCELDKEIWLAVVAGPADLQAYRRTGILAEYRLRRCRDDAGAGGVLRTGPIGRGNEVAMTRDNKMSVTDAQIEAGCEAYRRSHHADPMPDDIKAIYLAMSKAETPTVNIEGGLVERAVAAYFETYDTTPWKEGGDGLERVRAAMRAALAASGLIVLQDRVRELADLLGGVKETLSDLNTIFERDHGRRSTEIDLQIRKIDQSLNSSNNHLDEPH